VRHYYLPVPMKCRLYGVWIFATLGPSPGAEKLGHLSLWIVFTIKMQSTRWVYGLSKLHFHLSINSVVWHLFVCMFLLVWIVLGTNLVAHAWQVHYSNNSNEAQLCRITTLKSQIHVLWSVPGMVAKMHRNASSVFGLYCTWGHFSSSIFHSVWSL
jgi:hypothetical protein